MVNESRRIFQERLPEAAKADDGLHALILAAWDQATPPPPPVVLVQRVDYSARSGKATEYEVIDRRRVRGERVTGRYPNEAAARAEQLRRLPVGGGAINLAAVDTDEYFHDTDYELLGNQQRYGVLGTGCNVTFDAANMTLDMGLGAILHNGALVNVAAETDALTLVADGSNERWSYVTLDATGDSVLVSGDAAASSSVEPTKPELGDRVLVYMVKIQAAQTIANNAEYKLDKRILIRFPIQQRKAADEAVVNNSTAFANEDEFIINVAAGDTLQIYYRLYITNVAAASGKFALTFPAASTAVGGGIAHGALATAEHRRTTPAAMTTGLAFATFTAGMDIQYAELDAYFVFTAAGTIRLQAAQETANATDFTIEAGSIATYQWTS